MRKAFLIKENDEFIIKNSNNIGEYYSHNTLNGIISFSINNIEYDYNNSSKEILENCDLNEINFVLNHEKGYSEKQKYFFNKTYLSNYEHQAILRFVRMSVKKYAGYVQYINGIDYFVDGISYEYIDWLNHPKVILKLREKKLDLL